MIMNITFEEFISIKDITIEEMIESYITIWFNELQSNIIDSINDDTIEETTNKFNEWLSLLIRNYSEFIKPWFMNSIDTFIEQINSSTNSELELTEENSRLLETNV